MGMGSFDCRMHTVQQFQHTRITGNIGAQHQWIGEQSNGVSRFRTATSRNFRPQHQIILCAVPP